MVLVLQHLTQTKLFADHSKSIRTFEIAGAQSNFETLLKLNMYLYLAYYKNYFTIRVIAPLCPYNKHAKHLKSTASLDLKLNFNFTRMLLMLFYD